MFDKNITIFNHKNGQWYKKVLDNCDVHYDTAKTVSSNGAIVMTPLLNITIPVQDGYVDAIEYENRDDVTDVWTINAKNNKDMIVVGVCPEVISETYRVSELKKHYQKCGVVASFADNTEGDLLQHYKVVCK